jgi:hypothetical protein
MPAAKPAKYVSPRKTKSASLKSITAKTSKSAKADFTQVFAALRRILDPFGKELAVQTDKPGNFHTEISSIIHRGKPLYFAGIRTGKNYVSFHLLPMYNSPQLHKGMSAALKKRMQGKACFNFTAVDHDCFAELSRLIAAGLKIFKSEKFRQSIQKMQ